MSNYLNETLQSAHIKRFTTTRNLSFTAAATCREHDILYLQRDSLATSMKHVIHIYYCSGYRPPENMPIMPVTKLVTDLQKTCH